MQDFTQSQAWQHAHRIVLNTYLLTEQFPPEEQFGLTQRVRGTATDIPTHIAQALSTKAAATHTQAAHAAANKLGYYLLLAHDLGYIIQSDFEEFVGAIGLMLNKLQEETNHD